MDYFWEGGERKLPKKYTMEVKTVKARKSDRQKKTDLSPNFDQLEMTNFENFTAQNNYLSDVH